MLISSNAIFSMTHSLRSHLFSLKRFWCRFGLIFLPNYSPFLSAIHLLFWSGVSFRSVRVHFVHCRESINRGAGLRSHRLYTPLSSHIILKRVICILMWYLYSSQLFIPMLTQNILRTLFPTACHQTKMSQKLYVMKYSIVISLVLM